MENIYIRHTDDEWLSIINKCRTSGCSDKLWCQDHNITPSTFYYQIRRLRKKACCIPQPVNFSAITQEVVQLDFSEQYGQLPSSASPLPEVQSAKTETALRITFRDIQIEMMPGSNSHFQSLDVSYCTKDSNSNVTLEGN